jgi:hypothetical protein
VTAKNSYGLVRPDPRRRSFAPTPEELLLDKTVSNRAKVLWGILDRIAKGREAAIGSRAGLADKLNCSTASLDRARDELEQVGWLGVERLPGGVNRYTPYDSRTPISTTLVTGEDTPNGRLVTGDDPPSSPVMTPPSSPVMTGRRGTTGEGREPPPTPPAPRGGSPELHPDRTAWLPPDRSAPWCGHDRPTRGCCTARAAAARAAKERDAAVRMVPWCGGCDNADTRRVINADGYVTAQLCPTCNPTATHTGGGQHDGAFRGPTTHPAAGTPDPRPLVPAMHMRPVS